MVEPQDVASLHAYDAVVLGSGIYAGRWLPAAKDFVERFTDELRGLPVWLFSSGPLGDPPFPAQDPPDAAVMVAATGCREHRVLPGRLDRRRLSLGERAIVKVVKAAEGDYRDWRQVTGWAAEIAAALQPAASGL